MAYCVKADVVLYAPQTPSAETCTGYIAQADGVIDARLRDLYVVPLTTVDQWIKGISARMAASYLLAAYYSQHGMEPNKYADELMAAAMADLDAVRSNPSLLSVLPRDRVSDDAKKDGVLVSDTDAGVFTMGDETEWGSARASRVRD